MNLRLAQTALLLTAMLIGLLNDSFNGLSLLALICVALTAHIAYRSRLTQSRA